MSKTQPAFDPASAVEHVNAEPNAEQHVQPNGNSPSEGQPSATPEVKPDAIPEGSSPEKVGQPNNDDMNREIDSRVSKGVEKANDSVQKLLDIVSMRPENIEAIKESQPELFEELQKRFPGKFDVEVEAPEDARKSKQVRAAEMLLKLAGKQTIDKWAEKHGISPEDLSVRQKDLLADADTLQVMTGDFESAVEMAGQIHFPHIKSPGMNNQKVTQIAGQTAKTSHHNPMNDDGFDDEDRTVMRQHGLNETDYKEAIGGFQLPV